MQLSREQENEIQFVADELSRMMGGLDFLVNTTMNRIGDIHEHSALQMADELKLAIDHLRAARKLGRNVIDAYYEQIVEGAKQ